MTDSRESGQLCYEAYASARNWAGMSPWGYLSAADQDAWREAAHETIRKAWVESARAPRHRRD